jgi:hypothetical protein
MTDKNNEVKFSIVIKVKISEKAQSIKAVPNPVTNNTLNLQFTNIKAGKYKLTMFDIKGQVVYSSTVTYNGLQAMQSLQLPASVSKGIYNLQFSNTNDVVKTVVLLQ